MGGEKYRYIYLNRGEVSDEARKHYTGDDNSLVCLTVTVACSYFALDIFGTLESRVNAFVERDPGNRTQVSSDEELIVISTTTTDGRCRESRLTLSRHLDELAELGWQDRRYGREVDPRRRLQTF